MPQIDGNRHVNGNAICEDSGDGSIQMDPIRKDGTCRLVQCESDFRSPRRGERGSRWEKVGKQEIIKLFGQERLLSMHANTLLKSWLFSNSFLWGNLIFQQLQILLNESLWSVRNGPA